MLTRGLASFCFCWEHCGGSDMVVICTELCLVAGESLMVSEKITQLFRSSEHGTVFWAALPAGQGRRGVCPVIKGNQRKDLRAYPSLSGGSDGKESARNTGDSSLTPGWGRSPGEGNGSPFQYSCLGNPEDRGDWWVTVYGVIKGQRGLSD